MPSSLPLTAQAVVEPDTERIVPDGGTRRPEDGGGAPAAPKGPTLKLGYLLEEPDSKKVAQWIARKRRAQDQAMRSRQACWEVYSRRRDGDPWVRLRKVDMDRDIWEVYDPPGSSNSPPTLSKTDDLCSKVVSNLTVDPPRADCEPSRDDDTARGAAEFSTRLLQDLQGESGLNRIGMLREALEIACSTGSAFEFFSVDPYGGGYQPKQIVASMAATSPEDALFMLVPGPVDPVTGMPGPAVQTPQPEPYVIRYVTEAGTLTDEPSEAALQWLPSLRGEVFHPKHVRFLPETVTDGLRSAWGVILSGWFPLGRLRAIAGEEFRALPPSAYRQMVNANPQGARDLLPSWAWGVVDDDEGKRPLPGSELPPDDCLVFCDLLYITGKGNPEYPKGCYVWSAAEQYVVNRGTWCQRIAHEPFGPTVDDTAEEGSQNPQERFIEYPADLPLTQVKMFPDPRGRDPYGVGLVEKLGDGDSVIANQLASLIQFLWKANNPRVFVPIGSGIQDNDLALPSDSAIPFNGQVGTPVIEKVGGYPGESLKLMEMVSGAMDSLSGLQQAAQGLEASTVNSGIHAQAIIEQAKVALSAPKGGLDEAFVRGCRVVLQGVRQKFTAPQKLRITGESGGYKMREWTASDLGSTTDVRIAPGSSTMMTPSVKAQLLADKVAAGTISPEDAQRAEEGNVRTLIGMQDNPHRQRILSDLERWSEGPPDGWMPLPPVPQQDPSTGAVALIPAADPASPFDARPTDEDPTVALIRYAELRRFIDGSKYASKPPEWRQLVDAAYEQARQAAGVLTMAEQQAAAAAQQQAELEARNAGKDSGNAGPPKGAPLAQDEGASARAPGGPMAEAMAA